MLPESLGIILASVTMQQNVFVKYILWTTRNLQLDELELVPNVSMDVYTMYIAKNEFMNICLM